MPPPPPRRPNPRAAAASSGGAGAASKEENIYIPSFISKRPFYTGEEGDDKSDYLEHQRLQKKKEETSWYDRGRKAGPAATKYRKGACENCGAMTHKAKDCLSRPRAKGAKWTGRDIQSDEVIQDVRLGWDAKRDRWNGYDPKEYKNVVEEFNHMEELRKQALPEAEEDEGDKYAEENDMSKHQSTATRQLRIREDTAKYLVNLDLDSAKYDPKTRSLIDAGATNDKAANLFAEQGYVRASGDAAEFERAQQYAWEAQEKAGDSSQHLQANPTAGEFSRRKQKEEEERARAEKENKLKEMYGDDSAYKMPDSLKNMVTETEEFVEYDEAGLIKGAPRAVAKSKYAEDVLVNNHTSVWGSWWDDFRWGYACCHSIVKNSYCTGEEGKAALEASERQRMGIGLLEQADMPEASEIQKPKKEEAGEDGDGGSLSQSQFAKKRTAEEMRSGVSEEDLDAYRRKRTAADDPMAKFLGKDELVH